MFLLTNKLILKQSLIHQPQNKADITTLKSEPENSASQKNELKKHLPECNITSLNSYY